MDKFLAVFYGTESSMKEWSKLDEATRQQREKQGIAAWSAWVNKNEKFIIDIGAPLGKTKCADKKGISGTKNELTAYTIVLAESHEAAARLFMEHPHFTIFPGDRIEIMECLPIPKL